MLAYRFAIPDIKPKPKAPEPEPIIDADAIDWRPRHLISVRRPPIFSAKIQSPIENMNRDRNALSQPQEIEMAKAKKTVAKKPAAKPAASSTGAAKPGVIATIVDCISKEEGSTVDETLEVLKKAFKDRDPAGMRKTAMIQSNKQKTSKKEIDGRGTVFYKRR